MTRKPALAGRSVSHNAQMTPIATRMKFVMSSLRYANGTAITPNVQLVSMPVGMLTELNTTVLLKERSVSTVDPDLILEAIVIAVCIPRIARSQAFA